MKINGTTIPNYLVVPVIMFAVAIGSLFYQANANSQEIEKLSDTAERLARIEVTIEHNKEKLEDLKEEQKESAKKLDKILEAVKK